MRHNSTVADLLARPEAAYFLVGIANGALPAPQGHVLGNASKAGSQLVWLGLAYRHRTTPPTYSISSRGKEALAVLEEVTRALRPLAQPAWLSRGNEFAEASLEELERLLRSRSE
jgi:hypothetical protein